MEFPDGVRSMVMLPGCSREGVSEVVELLAMDIGAGEDHRICRGGERDRGGCSLWPPLLGRVSARP